MARDFRARGVPLIRLAGLKQGAHMLSGCNYLDPAMVATKWAHFRVSPGDVLLSTSASLGEVAVVGETSSGAIPYTGIIRFRPRDCTVLPEFIPFALTAPSFKRQIESMGVGSVMRHFGPSHLGRMTVSIPPVTHQRAIAEVLGALDDKIAANAKKVAIADDLRGSYFEAMFAQSQTRPLTDLAFFINGRAFTKDASGSGRVVIRIAELNSGLGASTVYNDLEVAEQHVAEPGDLLFAWSGSLTLNRWYRPEAIINQHIFKVIPKDGYPIWLVDGLLQRRLQDFKEIAADKATTMGHIQRQHLDEPVAVPDQAAIHQYGTRMVALWNAALDAEQESLALAQMRDTLLPHLMSGRLRVRDAEKIVRDRV